MMDMPTNSSAILSWPDMPSKKSVTLKKAAMSTLRVAHQQAVVTASTMQFNLGWAIVGDNNNVVVVNNATPPEDARTTDVFFHPILENAGILSDIVAITEEKFYVFSTKTNLWVQGSQNMAASKIRDAVASTDPMFRDSLSPSDVAYLGSCDGPNKVIKSIVHKLIAPGFQKKLNKIPDGHIAFNNGFFSVDTGLRPFCKEDYISETIGFDFVPEELVDEADFVFLRDFYGSAFPDPAERTYFLRAIAKALLGCRPGKYFLILSDTRDGSNLKTSIMRSVEAAFGQYKAVAEREFLYESTSTSSSGSNPNFLAYAGKRLAFFDEPSASAGHSTRRLDLTRIKDLTSGTSRIRGRYNHANTMEEERFTCLIVIACNENNFPKVDGTDLPFVKRMKPVKMRSVFVTKEEYATRVANGDENVYILDEASDFEFIYEQVKMAHVHLLIKAYREVSELGGSLGPEPPCIKEMLDSIMASADPRMDKAAEFIDEYIDFKPDRKKEFAGCMYYAWITGKDMFNMFWEWYETKWRSEFKSEIGFEQDKKSKWIIVVKAVMKTKGREFKKFKPTVDGKRPDIIGFDRVAFKSSQLFVGEDEHD